MKKITVCLLFLLVLVAVSSFGQELGQKVYREVTINGEVVKKWVKVIGIEDYDERGKALYEKDIDGFTQYEYDDKGNEIHWIWQTGKDRYEYWYEYDDQNRKIHQSETKPKKNSFKGTWYEYDDKGNLIREVDKDRTGKKITGEVLYENDGEGKLIHKKISYNETYYENITNREILSTRPLPMAMKNGMNTIQKEIKSIWSGKPQLEKFMSIGMSMMRNIG